MLGKLLDLLGFSDGGEVAVNDYREQRRGRLERLKEHRWASRRHDLGERIVLRSPVEDRRDPEFFDRQQDDRQDRRDRRQSENQDDRQQTYQTLPIVPGLILVRGPTCAKLLDDLVGALKLGKLVLVDLQGIDLDGGQRVLNSLHEEVRGLGGGFFRVDRSCFLASPVKDSVEEWMLEGSEIGGFDE